MRQLTQASTPTSTSGPARPEKGASWQTVSEHFIPGWSLHILAHLLLDLTTLPAVYGFMPHFPRERVES